MPDSSGAMSGKPVWYWCLTGLAFMLVMYVASVFQYRSTYTSVYDESAVRRISLSEKLPVFQNVFLKSYRNFIGNCFEIFQNSFLYLQPDLENILQ